MYINYQIPRIKTFDLSFRIYYSYSADNRNGTQNIGLIFNLSGFNFYLFFGSVFTDLVLPPPPPDFPQP